MYRYKYSQPFVILEALRLYANAIDALEQSFYNAILWVMDDMKHMGSKRLPTTRCRNVPRTLEKESTKY
jgi:hypothetical protein